MSFDLDALFQERMELFTEPSTSEKLCQEYQMHVGSNDLSTDENQDTRVLGEDLNVRNIIKSLVRERDFWKATAQDLTATIEDLDQRACNSQLNMPNDAVRRLNRLDAENIRLKTEVMNLRDNLRAAESENATLYDENDGKARKHKGANRKVRNAKDVAGKEEEKAEDARSDKQRHLASERMMKKERNDTLAALQEQTKINEGLLTELSIEQSGTPHLRDTAIDPDNTTVVIPVQFEIRRTDFLSLLMSLEANQMAITENIKRWYEVWKKPEEESRQVVGADYVDDDKKAKAKVFEDMIEMSGGYMETGAEHDGHRSKRSLRAVCRHAEARFNSGND